jgi:hypothetical protein
MRTGGVEPPQPEATRLQRGELSRAQRPLVSGAGGIRTHGLELMRLARTAPPLPREVWQAGVEPAISGSRNRRGGQLPHSQATFCATIPLARTRGARRSLKASASRLAMRAVPSPTEPGAALAAPGRSTTVESNHAPPPYQSGACPAGPSSKVHYVSRSIRSSVVAIAREADAFAISRDRGAATSGSRSADNVGRRQGIAPCLPGSQPGGSLLAVRRSLAGRIRTPVTPTVGAWCSPLSYGERETPSTGVEPASPGRQPGRVSRRVRGRAVTQYPERESNPRFRCERPASSTARRSGQDRCEAATAGVEPAFAG